MNTILAKIAKVNTITKRWKLQSRSVTLGAVFSNSSSMHASDSVKSF